MFLDSFISAVEPSAAGVQLVDIQGVSGVSDQQVGAVVQPLGADGLIYKAKKYWAYLVVIGLAGYHWYASTKKRTSFNRRR